MRPSVTACIASSSRSKTRAGPRCCERPVAATFTHAALWRKISAHLPDHQAARGLNRIRERTHHFLPRRFHSLSSLDAERTARRGHLRTVDISAVDETLHDHRNSTGAMHVGGDKISARFQIHEHGRPRTDRIENPQSRAGCRPRAPSPIDAEPHWSSHPWQRRRWQSRSRMTLRVNISLRAYSRL